MIDITLGMKLRAAGSEYLVLPGGEKFAMWHQGDLCQVVGMFLNSACLEIMVELPDGNTESMPPSDLVNRFMPAEIH